MRRREDGSGAPGALTRATAPAYYPPMPRTILVTEGDSPLGATLARLFLGRGYSVVTTHERATSEPAPAGGAGRASLAVTWNRRSPVSARTVVLSALNAFASLDEVLILEPPSGSPAALADTASADIEAALDSVKGPAFLGRELWAHFLRQGRGVMAWVSLGPWQGPLQAGVREGFRGMASAVLAEKVEPGLIANAFRTESVDTAEYAAFIDRTLEEKARSLSGRWFSCPQRGGFFPGRNPR